MSQDAAPDDFSAQQQCLGGLAALIGLAKLLLGLALTRYVAAAMKCHCVGAQATLPLADCWLSVHPSSLAENASSTTCIVEACFGHRLLLNQPLAALRDLVGTASRAPFAGFSLCAHAASLYMLPA